MSGLRPAALKSLGFHLSYCSNLSDHFSARIFRYILLDEIDRTFPLLNYSLVQSEIKSGRIATILDGFDELLRKSQETGDFENQEPMLETISELLTGNSKIIITTRRTVLFDGDEFHQWLEKHAEAFEVVRIRISEPRVKDWLPGDRLEGLEKTGLSMDAIANPVLLSYLRSIDDATFHDASADADKIVESYFEYMIEREKTRQDLLMTFESQSRVLKGISTDMIERKYTAESRDYIVSLLLKNHSREIDETRSQYSAADRPSREEIANKLASHALLDRSATDPKKIGFINEFALGNYVAANILDSSDWLNDDLRFIDPAVRSFAPRSTAARQSLYDHVAHSLPYLDLTSQVEITSQLIRQLPIDLTNGEIEKLAFEQINIGNPTIVNIQFNECIFRNCEFHKDGLSEVSFLNCKFYECKTLNGTSSGNVYVLGGFIEPELYNSLAFNNTESEPLADRTDEVDGATLKKFWPVGEYHLQRPSRPIYKPLKHLCRAQQGYSSHELFESVNRLLRSGVLSEMPRSRLITLELERLPEIQEMIMKSAK
jgi:hypothetical protein